MIAAKAMRLSGKVITTPFTFAATSNVLPWCNLKPVYVDVEEETLNIDCSKIEEFIDGETSGILPVHVFGNPCDVETLDEIARKYNLKLIYDAAHAFGVEIRNKSIAEFGDTSMFSFHATKVFHTIEGGALAFKNRENKERADRLCNFGLMPDGMVNEAGINTKLNEIQAAVGLVVFEMFEEEIQKRKNITNLYRDILKDVEGLKLFKDIPGVKHNYPYFVVRVTEEFGKSRDEVFDALKEYNIFSRKYFYPLCSKFNCFKELYNHPMPVAEKAASQVIALPLYGSLRTEEVEQICNALKEIKIK